MKITYLILAIIAFAIDCRNTPIVIEHNGVGTIIDTLSDSLVLCAMYGGVRSKPAGNYTYYDAYWKFDSTDLNDQNSIVPDSPMVKTGQVFVKQDFVEEGVQKCLVIFTGYFVEYESTYVLGGGLFAKRNNRWVLEYLDKNLRTIATIGGNCLIPWKTTTTQIGDDTWAVIFFTGGLRFGQEWQSLDMVAYEKGQFLDVLDESILVRENNWENCELEDKDFNHPPWPCYAYASSIIFSRKKAARFYDLLIRQMGTQIKEKKGGEYEAIIYDKTFVFKNTDGVYKCGEKPGE